MIVVVKKFLAVVKFGDFYGGAKELDAKGIFALTLLLWGSLY